MTDIPTINLRQRLEQVQGQFADRPAVQAWAVTTVVEDFDDDNLVPATAHTLDYLQAWHDHHLEDADELASLARCRELADFEEHLIKQQTTPDQALTLALDEQARLHRAAARAYVKAIELVADALGQDA